MFNFIHTIFYVMLPPCVVQWGVTGKIRPKELYLAVSVIFLVVSQGLLHKSGKEYCYILYLFDLLYTTLLLTKGEKI